MAKHVDFDSTVIGSFICTMIRNVLPDVAAPCILFICQNTMSTLLPLLHIVDIYLYFVFVPF